MFYAHAHSGRTRLACLNIYLTCFRSAGCNTAAKRWPPPPTQSVMCLFNDRLVNQINITLTFGHYLEDEQIFCNIFYALVRTNLPTF